VDTVIDASALIAFLRDESGADIVENVLATPGKCYAHALNLCEVYYDFFRAASLDAAEAAIRDLLEMGIEERTDLDAEFWRDAGSLKAIHRRVSLADCCALALARRLGARLLSADRHELEPILSGGSNQIVFIR
jgi:PIN domain nuclease of toxin-antitoxin system